MLSDIQRPVSASVVKSIWRSVLVGNAAPAFSPEVDFVMMVGSSSTENAFGSNIYGRQENPARKVLCEAGLDVQIINAGVSGNVTLDVRNRLPALLTELARWGSRKGLVIVVIGSNDIGVTDFDDMPLATKNTMADNLRYIVAQLRTSGHQVLLGASNSRKGYNPLYAEWAEKFYLPLVKELTPEWLVTDAVEKYGILQTYLDYGDVVPDFYYADNLHPRGTTACPLIHANLARFLNEFTTPTKQTSSHDRFLISTHSTLAYSVGGINIMPDNAVGGALESVILSELVNLKGQIIAGSKITRTGSMYPSTGSTLNPNGVDLDVKHAMVNRASIYATTPWTLLFEPGIAFAGRSGVIKVMSNTTAAGRSLRVVVTGGATVVIQSHNAGALPLVGEIPFTADGSGRVELTMSGASSPHAMMNAIEFDFT